MPQQMFMRIVEDDPAVVDWMLGLTGERHQASPCTGASLLRSARWSGKPQAKLDFDLLVRLDHGEGTSRIVVAKWVGEWDPAVYHRLPMHAASAFEHFQLPVSLLVVCRTDKLARKYRRGVGIGPGSRIAVAAVGPADLPDLISSEDVPGPAAALAAMALRRGAGEEPVELYVAMVDRWLGELGPEQAAGYADRLLRILPEASGSLLRAVAESGHRHYHAKVRGRFHSSPA